MSAAEIIRELRALPLEEQLKVIAFSKELDKHRDLTRDEFLQLADGYRIATDRNEVAEREAGLVRAFYGPEGHA
ncbi:MAG: hypothetical protein J0L84_00200 [Verrucomicrobia bacterium]|jgi:hypothetical protein|nr:hypothetical protein [Verrucomicrobiota bacterium]